MSIFSDNMRYLRGQLNYSQQKVADSLSITRGRYAKYEDGASEPPIDILLKISRYYKVSIDLMVSVDVKKYSLDDMVNLPDNRIVLPVKVDKTGENKIEIVPHKASMGYLSGYSDPEYIESLQYMSLPFLRNGIYRAFPGEGDSMPPYNDKTLFIGKYIESKDDLKAGKTYIFVTREGIVYKRYNQQNEHGTFVSSDNTFYHPYEIEWAEVLEIWEYECSINRDELGSWNTMQPNIQAMFLSLKNDIQIVKNQLDKK